MAATFSEQNARTKKYYSNHTKAEKWAVIWFEKLCQFHRVSTNNSWNFSAEQVIAFLRSRIKRNDPAWKRLKVVQALMLFRRLNPVRDPASLKFIERKLKQIAQQEASKSQATSLGSRALPDSSEKLFAGPGKPLPAIDVVGKIDSREPVPIQQMRRKLRLAGREWNTEKAYIKWTKRFLRSRDVSSVEQCKSVDRKDVEAFLTDLVVDGNVAASTQDQAFYALKFFFEEVLEREIGDVDALRSTKPKLRPTVMSKNEVGRVLNQMDGTYLLIAQLLYGCGMRIGEVLRLRVKDFDFDQSQIVVHSGKGKKSRLVPLPESIAGRLREAVNSRRLVHERDLAAGVASVWLPAALAQKFPTASKDFRWQFLFASARHSKDPKTGQVHRHHLHRDSFSAALRRSVKRAKLLKYVTAHTFRHSFATHLLQDGTDIRTVQELLGHADVTTTMIYTHVLFDENRPVKSPLDLLLAG